MTNETTPQRARRMGKEYAETYHDRWNADGKKWIRFAFTKGYQAACEDQAEEAVAIHAAIDAWEAGGDDEALVNEHIDPWLDAIFDRGRNLR